MSIILFAFTLQAQLSESPKQYIGDLHTSVIEQECEEVIVVFLLTNYSFLMPPVVLLRTPTVLFNN